MTEANDKLTALERALSELRHAQGAWQVNHLNLKFVAELNAAEDALIEAARAEGVQDGRSEAADLDVIEAYEKGLAEGRAAAANDRSSERSEANTCATCQFLYPLVVAADRMRDRWAEADDAVRRELWQGLHTAAQLAGEHIYPLEPRAEANDEEGEG